MLIRIIRSMNFYRFVLSSLAILRVRYAFWTFCAHLDVLELEMFSNKFHILRYLHWDAFLYDSPKYILSHIVAHVLHNWAACICNHRELQGVAKSIWCGKKLRHTKDNWTWHLVENDASYVPSTASSWLWCVGKCYMPISLIGCGYFGVHAIGAVWQTPFYSCCNDMHFLLGFRWLCCLVRHDIFWEMII